MLVDKLSPIFSRGCICKIILNYNYDDIASSMNDLKIMNIYERIFMRKAKFMFKIYHSIIYE